MDWVKAALLTGLLHVFLLNMAPESFASDHHRGCRRNDRIQIEDLDVSPDPIVEGGRIRAWKVRLTFDAKRDCQTDIAIRERGDVIAEARNIIIRPGLNEINLRPTETYRFHGREHCFRVEVDLDGAKREAEAKRRFCAQQRSAWSLREAADPSGPSFR
jgi:hypothetical protein